MNEPLRVTLRAALISRERMIRNGWSRRKDHDRMNAAISRCWTFLNSYPVADDARVKQWCLDHHSDVAIIVPGNTPTALARLVMDGLKEPRQGKVIPINRTNAA